MTAIELENGIEVCHTKYRRNYRVVECNCRMKDSVLGWIDCVIYSPLYPNDNAAFAREKGSFLNEFEKV